MIIGNNNGILLSIKKPTTCDLRLVADAERYVYVSHYNVPEKIKHKTAQNVRFISVTVQRGIPSPVILRVSRRIYYCV